MIIVLKRDVPRSARPAPPPPAAYCHTFLDSHSLERDLWTTPELSCIVVMYGKMTKEMHIILLSFELFAL